MTTSEPACDPVPACPGAPAPPALDRSPQWARIRGLLESRAPIDVAEVNLLVSQARDPRVDVAANLRRLDAMAREVRAALPRRCDARCRITALNRYLFRTRGFRAEFDPSGLYRNVERDLIDRVLESRTGYCEGLTFLYLALGARLGIPLSAVAGRQHMYVRYQESGAPAIDIDVTQDGRAPVPDGGLCQAQPSVYNTALTPRELVGHALSLLALADGYVSLPWLDEAARLAPRGPEIHNNRGLELSRWDPREALASYQRARTLDPCVPRYTLNEARMLYGLGQRDEARALVDALEARVARERLPDGPVFVSVLRGSFAFEEHRDDEADRHLGAALLASDGAPAVLEAMAAARHAQGRDAEAVNLMRSALVLNPTVHTRVGLITVLVDAGYALDAVNQLTRAAREEPTAYALDLHAALVANAVGRDDDAWMFARRCIERMGLRCARALVTLGDVAQRRGNPSCARRYYEAFLGCPRPMRPRGLVALEDSVRARVASLDGRDRVATSAAPASR